MGFGKTDASPSTQVSELNELLVKAYDSSCISNYETGAAYALGSLKDKEMPAKVREKLERNEAASCSLILLATQETVAVLWWTKVACK